MSHTSLSILQYFKLLNCTAHDILLTIYSSFFDFIRNQTETKNGIFS